MNTNTNYISPENMKLIVARIRGIYINRYGASLPFNAELFLESEYGMTIIPVPRLKNLGLECAFSRNGKTILVDEHDYNNPAKCNRLCFTFAHELAHKVLHEKHLPFIDSLEYKQMGWIERQARMFAAEFLMPEHLVLGVIATEILDRIEGIVDRDITIDVCVEYKIQEIAGYFGVSVDAMRNRIKNIDLSAVLTGPYISRGDVDTLNRLSNKVRREKHFARYVVKI